jgi:hypothetical protein
MVGVFINLFTSYTPKRIFGRVHVKFLKLLTRLLNVVEFIFSPLSFFDIFTPHSIRVFTFPQSSILNMKNLFYKLVLAYKNFILSLFDLNP